MASPNRLANRTRINAFAVTMLMVLYLASLSVTSTVAGQTSESGDIPGVPDDALLYDKSTITPVCETEQVMAGVLNVFRYRTCTLMLDCTRNCELVVTVDPTVNPKIFGLSIDPNQTMTLTMSMSGSPLQGERIMERTLNFYLGLEPNATLQLSAQIRLHINEAELNQQLNRVVDASRLTWMYWNKTRLEWVPVPSYVDQNGYLVCTTNHFSTWTIAEQTESTSIPAELIYGGVAAVGVIVLTVGSYTYTKRKK